MDKEREKEQPEKSKEKWEMVRGDQNLKRKCFKKKDAVIVFATTEKMTNKMRITKAGIRFDNTYLVTSTAIHLNRLCRYCMLKGIKSETA